MGDNYNDKEQRKADKKKSRSQKRAERAAAAAINQSQKWIKSQNDAADDGNRILEQFPYLREALYPPKKEIPPAPLRRSVRRETLMPVFTREYDVHISKIAINPKDDSCLAMDFDKRKWIIRTIFPYDEGPVPHPQDKTFIFDYDDLISYELCCDGVTVDVDDVYHMLCGAIIAGTTGAIIGAAVASNKKDAAKDLCSSMYIKIIDSNASIHKITLVDSVISKQSPKFKKAVDAAEEFTAMLEVIKAK